jgi:hypothetical protein
VFVGGLLEKLTKVSSGVTLTEHTHYARGGGLSYHDGDEDKNMCPRHRTSTLRERQPALQPLRTVQNKSIGIHRYQCWLARFSSRPHWDEVFDYAQAIIEGYAG